MERITWSNEKRKISDITPANYNPRQLTEKQAKDLNTSLERFNLADPVIINADNTIIGGHQRINILKQRGAVEVDVRVPSRQLTEHVVAIGRQRSYGKNNSWFYRQQNISACMSPVFMGGSGSR